MWKEHFESEEALNHFGWLGEVTYKCITLIHQLFLQPAYTGHEMASTVAMSATTPVKVVSGGVEDMTNGSPLPTPPQATHDLRRFGNGAARISLQGSRSTDANGHYRSSSPSSRAALASGSNSRDALKLSDLNCSPAISSSISANVIHQRQALGTQMGILNQSLHQSSSRAALWGETSVKPIRPGALNGKSQRSASYEASSPSHGDQEEVYNRMTSSLIATVAEGSRYVEGEKENAVDMAKSGSGLYRKTSAARRPSSKRSPSPTATATAIATAHPAASISAAQRDSAYFRNSSAENNEKDLESRTDAYNKSKDVGGTASSRRRDVDGHSPRQYECRESAAFPSMSVVTPGLNGAARALRAGQAPPKHVVAPWSVGRSMKRLNQDSAPLKPPQRVIAVEEADEEPNEGGERDCEGNRDHEETIGSSKHSQWQLHSQRRETGQRSPREMHNNGNDGSNRSPPVSVPLGADEDEEEDDFIHDHHRSLPRSEAYSLPVRKVSPVVPSREAEQEVRRNPMRDIISAKVPPAMHKRSMEGGPSMPLAASVEAPINQQIDHRADFMAQVRQEAARQKGQEHLDRLNGKPSKDLETKFNGYKFKKIRKAGEGGFSTVWQVRGPFAAPDPANPGSYIDIPDEEQAYFAMKQVTLKKMEKISREEVLEECNLLQTLAGENGNEKFILRFFGWKSSTGSLKILLELGEHDFNHILREGRLSRQQIRDYWRQMLEAVHFTHEKGNIVHTDLKPANFLMANGRLKLIDFGIAQKIPMGTIHIKRDAMIGTPNYMAPETVKAVKEARREGRDARVYKAGKASDVWALGCIFYQMVYNRPPFEAFHGDEKLKEILDPNHTIQYPTYRPAPQNYHCDDGGQGESEMELVDEAMINVMHLTFIYDPSERVGIPKLLKHCFLSTMSPEEETIVISRSRLKEIMRRIMTFTNTLELREDNLDQKSDDLFNNIRDEQARWPL